MTVIQEVRGVTWNETGPTVGLNHTADRGGVDCPILDVLWSYVVVRHVYCDDHVVAICIILYSSYLTLFIHSFSLELIILYCFVFSAFIDIMFILWMPVQACLLNATC